MFGPISVENAEYFKLGLNSLWTGITKKDTKWQYGNDTEANLMDWASGQPSKTVSLFNINIWFTFVSIVSIDQSLFSPKNVYHDTYAHTHEH